MSGPADSRPAPPTESGDGQVAAPSTGWGPDLRPQPATRGRNASADRNSRRWTGIRSGIRAEARTAVLLLLGGIIVAALWRLLAPPVARGGNPLEAAAAVDGTLALLGVAAGMVTAACVLLWPGRHPAVRATVTLAAAALAGVTSWLVGDLLGTPPLRARGAALVWPIIAAAGLFVGSFLPGLSRRLDP